MSNTVLVYELVG